MPHFPVLPRDTIKEGATLCAVSLLNKKYRDFFLFCGAPDHVTQIFTQLVASYFVEFYLFF